MTEAVLDTSAILALYHGERGAERVAEAIPGGIVSAINLAEAATKLTDRDVAEAALDTYLDRLALQIIAFDALQARETARMRPGTRRFGLSLGDRACLVLARMLRLPALTADQEWAELDIGVEVRLIR
jgi:ribonuclease VapC